MPRNVFPTTPVRLGDSKPSLWAQRYLWMVMLAIPLLLFLLWKPYASIQSQATWVRQPETRAAMYKELSASLPANPTVVEVGVWRGGNAQLLHDILRPGRLVLADLWAETEDPRFKAANERLVRNRFRGQIAKGVVQVRKGPSFAQIEALGNAEVDVLYLDTTHMYDQTLRELKQAARVVKTSGFLCGHDFLQPKGQEMSYGVIAAVVEFALQRGWTITHVSKEPFRSFCMRRSAGLMSA